LFDGGSAILDYDLYYDNATGTLFSELEYGITELSYVVFFLNPGLIYQFEVRARNIYGFSNYSNIVAILAA
jgi:hypothetical protein